MSETIARFVFCQRCTKLYSTILHKRLHSRFDQIQSEDQGGFRRSYQAIYHIAIYRMIEQKCHEWRVKMWVATIDFVKAFDSINPNSNGTPSKPVVSNMNTWASWRDFFFLKNRKSTVMIDEESDMFEVKKGDQAGWFAIQFALQHCTAGGLERWLSSLEKEKRMGICLGRC